MTDLGNVFILGDSYSTFEGHNPEGYDVWYSSSYKDYSDVRAAEECWWHKMLAETKSNLVRNCSYSGTTICHTGYNGEDCRSKSFIARLDKLADAGFFRENSIDTFFIFGGTNDVWALSPVGELQYSDWKEEDLFSVLPAFCYMLHRARCEAANARLICILNCDLGEELTENFKIACEREGVEYIPLHDIAKVAGHPTVLGMDQIKQQVLEGLDK